MEQSQFMEWLMDRAAVEASNCSARLGAASSQKSRRHLPQRSARSIPEPALPALAPDMTLSRGASAAPTRRGARRRGAQRELGSDLRDAAVVERSPLWKADRFVSWSLLTIGACLMLGVLVKFNAMGGVCFLASVVASQPFWVPGAQATYDQWVEIAALLAIAALPIGGWSGLDYFLKSWCPLSRCCDGARSIKP